METSDVGADPVEALLVILGLRDFPRAVGADEDCLPIGYTIFLASSGSFL
jgi:hypothetical protein